MTPFKLVFKLKEWTQKIIDPFQEIPRRRSGRSVNKTKKGIPVQSNKAVLDWSTLI